MEMYDETMRTLKRCWDRFGTGIVLTAGVGLAALVFQGGLERVFENGFGGAYKALTGAGRDSGMKNYQNQGDERRYK